MSSTSTRAEESVVILELLLLLFGIALLRTLLSPDSYALTPLFVLWFLLVTASYMVGEFETAVRANFGLSLKTQAAFALSYVGYSGIHLVWSWCELLSIHFWLGLWLFLNLVAPWVGLLIRRLVRQRALLVSDTSANPTSLLRWWGFECVETVTVDKLPELLRSRADQYGRLPQYDVIVVDTSNYHTEYAVSSVANEYFTDFVGIPSFTLSAYLLGPHPRYIGPYVPHIAARRVKRVIDLVLSVLAVIILSPLLLTIAILIKLDSPGPVFFRHRRLGRNMREFYLLKFRTMHRDADQRLERILASNPQLAQEFRATFKLRNDPRVTRLGRFLRRFSIDELPQFFNIIANEMSLVGPRPIVEKEVEYYRNYSLLLFRVPPGATGLWQVSGRSETSYEERVKLDTRYVEEWSLWNDLKILLRTVPAVLLRRGAY